MVVTDFGLMCAHDLIELAVELSLDDVRHTALVVGNACNAVVKPLHAVGGRLMFVQHRANEVGIPLDDGVVCELRQQRRFRQRLDPVSYTHLLIGSVAKPENITFSGDINVTEGDSAAELANAIMSDLPNEMLQRIYQK